MSSASLAHVRLSPPHSTQPDTVRIIALSATMALNLGILLIASRPMGAVIPHQPTPSAAATLLRWINPPAVVPPPPAIVMRPLRHPRTTAFQPSPKTAPVVTPIAPSVPSTDEGRLSAPSVTSPTVAPTAAAPSGKLAEANLAYRSAPLQFPRQAMREQLEGTVLLRVLVDENGKPIAVDIERSSGHALLDRSARQQVLGSWVFQPAIIDGKAVRAWATVPVKFDLHAQ